MSARFDAGRAMGLVAALDGEISHLLHVNRDLMAALKAVAADCDDEHSQAWLTPDVRRAVAAAINFGGLS